MEIEKLKGIVAPDHYEWINGQITEEMRVQRPYIVTGISYQPNGCCENRPILITAARREGNNYCFSCQCACGFWCSNGFDNPSDALKDYEKMTERYMAEFTKEERIKHQEFKQNYIRKERENEV